MAPDAEGYFTLPEMDLKIRAIGQRIILVDASTDEVLFDNSDLATALAEEQVARQVEQKAHEEALQAEQDARQATEEALQAEQDARQIVEASLVEAHQVRNQEIAQTMWQKGLDFALIMEVTGLSETALRNLIEQEDSFC